MIDLEAIRARDDDQPMDDWYLQPAEADRRALLRAYDELREAAGKLIELVDANALMIEVNEAYADLRRLLGEKT